MELTTKDTYTTQATQALTADELSSLVSLYQPLLLSHALDLYLTLYGEAFSQRGQENHNHLCVLLNTDIETLEASRQKLEEFGLCETYSYEDKHTYVYQLKHPLGTAAFLANDLFSRLLMSTLDKKTFESLVLRYQVKQVSLDSYKKVTKKFNRQILKDWNEINELEYSSLKPRVELVSNEDSYLTFTYEDIARIPRIVLPLEAKTPENIKTIAEVATLYGLSFTQVKQALGKTVSLSTNTLNVEKFKFLASHMNPEEKPSTKTGYAQSPVAFLQAKQAGIPVQDADKRLLEKLMIEMRLSPEVINVLVETVLATHDNTLPTSLVTKYAGSLVREGVKTEEEAKRYLSGNKKNSKPSGGKKTAPLPQYMSEKKKESSRSAEEEEALQERLARLGGKA